MSWKDEPPVMPNWWSKKYRVALDLRYLWFGKGEDAYFAAFRKLGFTDICECENDEGEPRFKRGKMRPNSGDTGQLECKQCELLLFPFQHLYECDECTEPTLADQYPLPAKEPFLCEDCQ